MTVSNSINVGSTPTQGNIDRFQGMGQIALWSPCICGSHCQIPVVKIHNRHRDMNQIVKPPVRKRIKAIFSSS